MPLSTPASPAADKHNTCNKPRSTSAALPASCEARSLTACLQAQKLFTLCTRTGCRGLLAALIANACSGHGAHLMPPRRPGWTVCCSAREANVVAVKNQRTLCSEKQKNRAGTQQGVFKVWYKREHEYGTNENRFHREKKRRSSSRRIKTFKRCGFKGAIMQSGAECGPVERFFYHAQ